MEKNENRTILSKLYLDPIESISNTKIKPKGYKIKGDTSKQDEKIKVLNSLPNLPTNQNQPQQPQPQRQEQPRVPVGGINAPQANPQPVFQQIPQPDPNVDYKEKYKHQIAQIKEMGIDDEEKIIDALKKCDGNVQYALNRLFG